MGKSISVTLDENEQEMLEILKEYDHKKSNPDALRALIAQGFCRIKKEKREVIRLMLTKKGVLPIKELWDV